MGRISKAWSRSANGMRHNLFAGVFIWIVATMVYFFYKSSEVCQNQLDELARIKLEYGYLYSACATGLFGGLIPFLAMFLEGVFHPAELFNGFYFSLFFGHSKGWRLMLFTDCSPFSLEHHQSSRW